MVLSALHIFADIATILVDLAGLCVIYNITINCIERRKRRNTTFVIGIFFIVSYQVYVYRGTFQTKFATHDSFA